MKSRSLVPTVLAFTAVALGSTLAVAQQQPVSSVVQTEVATTVQLHVFGGADRTGQLSNNLNALREHQERYYEANGRFTADPAQLRDFQAIPGAMVWVTTDPSGQWASLIGKLEGGGGLAMMITVKDSPQHLISGSFYGGPRGTAAADAGAETLEVLRDQLTANGELISR